MENLALAMKSELPLVYIQTDDTINVQYVLSHIAGEEVKPLNIPEVIAKLSDLKVPDSGRVFWTGNECKSLVKLYQWCAGHGFTIVFVNTAKSVLQFDAGTMFPPKELVVKFLAEILTGDQGDSEASTKLAEELMPAFGGMTLKEVGETAKMTMTRDGDITVKGVSNTRRSYNKLKGITQIATEIPYYVGPQYLEKWLGSNASFFMEPVHESLTPRGLLFDGPPGTGKTLASRHIAAAFGVPLYHLDLGAMMGKYVGDSENNLNSALAQIDQVEPCVVIFDEVEKVLKSSGDSGVTSRLVSTLLWWLQEHKSRVFTVMTTNDKSAIPTELYRPGRIDQVMAFNGIEGYNEGYDFTKGAFDALLKELDAVGDEDSYKELAKRTKELFADGAPVPQNRLTHVATGFVREMISEMNSEAAKAAIEGAQSTSKDDKLKVVKNG